MGRCKNPGHKRWRVFKRDGVWVVLDRAGKIRYAAAEHHMALSFALIQGQPQYKFATTIDASHITSEELKRIQRAIEKLFGKPDEEDNK